MPTVAIAQKVYKCIDANGTAIFSKYECGKDAEEIDTTKANRRPTQTPADREAAIDTDCRDRLKAVTKDYDDQMNYVQSQIDDLRASMLRSANNIAGATRNNGIEQHISSLETRNTALMEQRSQRVIAIKQECEASRARESKATSVQPDQGFNSLPNQPIKQ